MNDYYMDPHVPRSFPPHRIPALALHTARTSFYTRGRPIPSVARVGGIDLKPRVVCAEECEQFVPASLSGDPASAAATVSRESDE